MLELPEAQVIAGQIAQTLSGKIVRKVIADSSPHKFAFYTGDPQGYPALLEGKKIQSATPVGGQVEIAAQGVTLLLGDGANIRYFREGERGPEKHQLWVEFDDGSRLVCSVQMYGGLYVYPAGTNDNFYYIVARDKPSPLTDAFDEAYFRNMLAVAKPSLSVKAFLATEQRIPGLGNGVLQDILFNARINPRTKLDALSDAEMQALFASIKHTLAEMTALGGRDTEKDLFGQPGGYPTILSSKTLDRPCPRCGGEIVRQAFMGGNVYFCPNCQPVRG
jgi:formamidopyrimidine-DNA glycosylase